MLDLLAALAWYWGQPRFEALKAVIFPYEAALHQYRDRYLQTLAQEGFSPNQQGIWVQSAHQLLVNHQGDRPLAAASVTKVATSLAALDKYPFDYQFLTRIGTTGTLQNGVLRGDLVLIGGNDPLFIWEEAIAIGNALNRLGIRQVQGNLVIVPPFMMNFYPEPQTAAALFKLALDHRRWTPEIQTAYEQHFKGQPRPQVTMTGETRFQSTIPASVTLRLEHRSLPLGEIVRQMNIYSNNEIAETLAEMAGGAATVAQVAARKANVPPSEIQLINGSGLGEKNRISPRAACGMLLALQEMLAQKNHSLADVLPMAGRDRGTLEYRQLPAATLVKTGSLWNVSALVGVLPTAKYGTVCFALLNGGDNLEGFRQIQDRYVQHLSQTLQATQRLGAEFHRQAPAPRFGDPQRIQLLKAQ
ncbi:D-alanyl-D-alanine carboxypeptidase [Thermosynechococcus sp. CL-1]|uniref:D-alanyl-D-alanine carboxypeptidase n=1 Tax=Thermosynechococcus sp. CL-1 TaxID=2583530 RepID=UPI00122E1C94|nr:D-alanyl-D-alanine carboxypeptidase [Thermosynechococcus sp. CL-1]QEQ00860.1 D-alanyl-D-alanine carboxypeptidase [Thermosynechococcus sp. CL-1]